MSSLSARSRLSLAALFTLLVACSDKGEDCTPERDEDGDGYCGADDCDLQDGSIHPGATDRYQDGLDQDCDGGDGTDADGDGYPPGDYGTTDCDDNDASVGPGATELCDGADNDCDESVDEEDAADASTWYADVDGDGYGSASYETTACDQPEGYVSRGDDCDDQDAELNPGADDFTQDGVDQNCDDVDGTDRDGDGYIEGLDGSGDCDDGNAAVFPGAEELCDGVDNDCDAVIDGDGASDATNWYRDGDGDGYGDLEASTRSCAQPEEYVSNADDCDDTRVEVNPDLVETTYDGLDNDCDVGTLDDDLDGDGFALEEDCDDSDDTTWPGASEVCSDGVVNDCESSTADAMDECGLLGELSLSDADAKLTGELAGEAAGISTAGAGDVNGDGNADLLVGAYYHGEVAAKAGAVYLVLGPISGERSLGLSEARLLGQTANGYAGRSVARAEVDSDGYSDIIVGAYGEDPSGGNEGRAYLVHGPVSDDLKLLDEADLVLEGDVTSGSAGNWVGGVGDLDGDGEGDLIVGAPDGGAGQAYVVSGALSDVRSLVDEGTPISGEADGDAAGRPIESAGDVNGDGTDDLIIGAYGYGATGAAYLVLGPLTAALNLRDADTTMVGDEDGDSAGQGAASAGDVDGDGRADLLVGAPGSGRDVGAAYLLLGPSSGSAELGDISDAKLNGEAVGDEAGAMVSSAGDVDGDGLADLLVGAAEEGADDHGAAYLVLAPVTGSSGLASADLKLGGEADDDWAGSAVATAGDIDGDGFADLLVGALQEDSGATDAGAAYLVLGGGY